MVVFHTQRERERDKIVYLSSVSLSNPEITTIFQRERAGQRVFEGSYHEPKKTKEAESELLLSHAINKQNNFSQ